MKQRFSMLSHSTASKPGVRGGPSGVTCTTALSTLGGGVNLYAGTSNSFSHCAYRAQFTDSRLYCEVEGLQKHKRRVFAALCELTAQE